MKKFFKWSGRVIIVIILLMLCLVGYVKLLLPDVGDAGDLKLVYTPEMIERGAYLANSVSACMDCHSTRDWTQFSAPLKPGTLGMGGEKFDQALGFPGVFYSRNITPYGISRYTDGELFRVITTGVTKEGRAMFPVMPYHYYGKSDKEDIYAIIAYLRSLPSIESDVPESEADFPFSIILNTIPHKASFVERPKPSDSVAYGGYLVNMAGCIECHTKAENGQILAGVEFGGGREFMLPFGKVHTPNITPDETGIKAWTADAFVQRFKQYKDSSYKSPVMGPNDYNSFMPWTMYAGMTESDLRSIYKFLRTVKPIKNEVIRFTPKDQLASK